MTRRGWAIVIVSAWAVSLGWLFKRTYFRSTGAKLAEAALAVPPGAMFYRLAVGAQQLGYASTTIDTLRDSIRVEDVLVIDVPALGKTLYEANVASHFGVNQKQQRINLKQ